MESKISREARHFFHVVSNVRPSFWILCYLVLIPIFAYIYWLMPDTAFRVPSGGSASFGSCLYYSVVTISTLGFGDFTPAHGWAQAVTALEVMCGIMILGFFLSAVGSMRSYIDVSAEIEKQRQLHFVTEGDKLRKSSPVAVHTLNTFLSYCYAVTTPVDERTDPGQFDENFKFNRMKDLYKPAGIPFDMSGRTAVAGLIQAAARTSLYLDMLQARIDLSLWPELLDDCFSFVANYQMFSSADVLSTHIAGLIPEGQELTEKQAEAHIAGRIADWNGPLETDSRSEMWPVTALYYFIRENGRLALRIEAKITRIASTDPAKPTSTN